MNLHKKLLVDTIQSVLVQYDFKKEGSIWFKSALDIVPLLALEQSAYGANMFTIEIGVHVKSIANLDPKDPPVYTKKGTPRVALGNWQLMELFGGRGTSLATALDASSTLTNAERASALSTALTEIAVPLLRQFENRDSLANYIVEHNALATLSLREWLGLQRKEQI